MVARSPAGPTHRSYVYCYVCHQHQVDYATHTILLLMSMFCHKEVTNIIYITTVIDLGIFGTPARQFFEVIRPRVYLRQKTNQIRSSDINYAITATVRRSL